MTARFTALASGSAGNACLLEADGFGVLIDFGLGPRTLAGRMAARGLSWRDVNLVLLTHTHTDHWRETTLVHLTRLGVRLCCHAAHAEALVGQSDGFNALYSAGLVATYMADQPIDLGAGLTGLPLPVEHDAGETFGFRFEGGRGLFGSSWALGYAADLGCWDNDLAGSLANVDLLALEFNHDEHLQRTSGRPHYLIQRVLGDQGHLSNRQARDLLAKILGESLHASPRHVVPLHLSRQCNRPNLARAAANDALADAGRTADVAIAPQDEPGRTLMIEGLAAARTRRRPPAA
jgi:phosphoribosyl 1,2-cyclic phosphodiesterase